jgi:UDP-glucose 4-epimerase
VGIVAITGAGGYIGQRLISHLGHQERCAHILGTDITEPQVSAKKLTFHNKDIRDHSLIDFWKDQDVETLAHLAFIVDPIRNEKRMYDINVNGTLNVLRICEELEIGHIIVASSGSAYGAWPDNPEPLTEEHPIRQFPPSFSYPYHKGLMEHHCTDFMKAHPNIIFNIVRPCIVYGPNTDNYLARYFKNMPIVAGRRP